MLDDLTKDDLVRVLIEPKDALTEYYKTMFRAENTELTFTPGALNAIAEQACKRKVGARGLRSVMEDFMRPLMYELPDHPQERFVVDEKLVRDAIAGIPASLEKSSKPVKGLLAAKADSE